MSNFNEGHLIVETQEIHEENITIRFDVPKTLWAPWIGTLISHYLEFGVISIIGVNPNETQTGDIVVELMHNKCCTKA
jgi:hypothetical protein